MENNKYDTVILKAKIVKKAVNDLDMNIVVIGNNMICISNVDLNRYKYEFIKDSQGEWIRDNEAGVDYSCKIGLKFIE